MDAWLRNLTIFGLGVMLAACGYLFSVARNLEGRIATIEATSYSIESAAEERAVLNERLSELVLEFRVTRAELILELRELRAALLREEPP